jgi:hypothetical protein
MKIRASVKTGGKATPILERQKGALALLRDSGQTLKVKSGLKAGTIRRIKGE